MLELEVDYRLLFVHISMLALFRHLMSLFAIDALMSDKFFLFLFWRLFLRRVILFQFVKNARFYIILIDLLHQRLYGV